MRKLVYVILVLIGLSLIAKVPSLSTREIRPGDKLGANYRLTGVQVDSVTDTCVFVKEVEGVEVTCIPRKRFPPEVGSVIDVTNGRWKLNEQAMPSMKIELENDFILKRGTLTYEGSTFVINNSNISREIRNGSRTIVVRGNKIIDVN